MNYTVVFTLLATLFSNVSAISSTDALERRGIYNYAFCVHTCYISPGIFDDVRDCVSSRCEGVKPDNDGENHADASEVLISETETRGPYYAYCVHTCYVSPGFFDDVQDCVSSRCQGVKTENNGDASQVLISDTETAPRIGHDLAYYLCEDACYKGYIDDVQDCIRSKCEGDKAENDGENKVDASEVLISETDTAPDIGHDLAYYLCVDACYNGNFEETFADVENCISSRCEEDKAENDGENIVDASEVLISETETRGNDYYFCVFACHRENFEGTFADVQNCISSKCEGDKAVNDGENNADASQVLVSDTETAPDIGYDLAYFRCVDQCYNQNFEVEKCIRSRCERDEAENDGEKVLISETETAPGSHLSPCQQNCFRVGGSFHEVQDCLSRCRGGNTKNGDVKNTIVPEVDISENDSIAQTPLECVWDCLLALKVHAVSVDDIDQCKDQCGFSVTVGDYDGESNLRGSKKSDKAKLVPRQIVSNF